MARWRIGQRVEGEERVRNRKQMCPVTVNGAAESSPSRVRTHTSHPHILFFPGWVGGKKEDMTVNGGFINPPGTRQAPIALFSVTNIRLFREAQKPPKGILTAFVPPYGG